MKRREARRLTPGDMFSVEEQVEWRRRTQVRCSAMLVTWNMRLFRPNIHTVSLK